MAKLYFYYSSMNAGKSTSLLQSSYNYRERGMNTLVLSPMVDDREGEGVVASRIGLKTDATVIRPTDDLFKVIEQHHAAQHLSCVLIDEAQFLTRQQVFQLGEVCDQQDIPVLAYGIRTDFQGEPFEGSKYLLAWADNLKELKAICHCGRKATMVIRRDANASLLVGCTLKKSTSPILIRADGKAKKNAHRLFGRRCSGLQCLIVTQSSL